MSEYVCRCEDAAEHIDNTCEGTAPLPLCLCTHTKARHLDTGLDCLAPVGKRLDGRPIFCGCKVYAPAARPTEERGEGERTFRATDG